VRAVMVAPDMDADFGLRAKQTLCIFYMLCIADLLIQDWRQPNGFWYPECNRDPSLGCSVT
jgi:hypothetical protein